MFSGFNGLRGLMALLVVIYHINQLFVGNFLTDFQQNIHRFLFHLCIIVSAFFLLSGMFRSLSYWGKIQKNEKIPNFFSDFIVRCKRIAPLYYVSIILSAALMWYFWGFDSLDFWSIISGFLFISWISPETLFPVFFNGPLWFVTFDMMGWIFISLLMIAVSKVKGFWRYIIFLISIPVLWSLHCWWIALPWENIAEGVRSLWFPVYNPFLFGIHFVIGAAAGYGLSALSHKNIKQHYIFDIIFVGIFAIGMYFLWNMRGESDFLSRELGPYFFPYIPLGIAVLLIILPFTKVIAHYLDNSIFLFLGRISYSLFLTHMLVLLPMKIMFFSEGFDNLYQFFLFGIISLVIAISLAYLSHKYIELPLSKIKTPK